MASIVPKYNYEPLWQKMKISTNEMLILGKLEPLFGTHSFFFLEIGIENRL